MSARGETNLGKLARYLRLLGFDALSDGDLHDADLAQISAEQARILLTKDRPLLNLDESMFLARKPIGTCTPAELAGAIDRLLAHGVGQAVAAQFANRVIYPAAISTDQQL